MVLGARAFRPEGGLWWRRSVSGPLPSWALPAERPLDSMGRTPTSTSRHGIAVFYAPSPQYTLSFYYPHGQRRAGYANPTARHGAYYRQAALV